MMPLIGIVTKSVSFANIVWQVGSAQIKIGSFISTLITFIFTSLAVFVMIKGINAAQNLRKKSDKEEAEVVAETELSVLLEIRDTLAKNEAK